MTVKRIIAVTAAVTACAAPTASARVATDVDTTVKPAGMAGIAAHHEQISTEQWQRSARVSPVMVQSDIDGGSFLNPLILLAVPAGIALVGLSGRTVRRSRGGGSVRPV
jgi:hypothetical protein